MNNFIPRLVLALCLCGAPCSGVAEEIDFDRDVRPILTANCFACHGPDEETREADLRLDTAAGAIADLGGHVAIKPGDADASTLVRRIESRDEDELMPPPDSGHELSEDEKQTLKRWITAGAKYEVHWSFAPPIRASLTGSNVHPIDEFARRRLSEAGLTPNEPADRYQLIRRVTLDLIGLPPTPEQVDAFVADGADDAFEKVVDRLLTSESFGEHWARMWLDLARYADTKGYEKDNPREIWRYRDWVIESLNRDLPYDQFTISQLAGDLLPDAAVEQRLATAFHRNTLTNEEGGTDDEEFRVAAVKDRVDTTIQVWMGLTMGCAKCHSHKYDPITQEEYYRFFAFFNQTADTDQESPLMESPTEQQSAKVEALQKHLTSLRAELESDVPGFDNAYWTWLQEQASDPRWRPLELAEFQSEHEVTLDQADDRKLVVNGRLPDEDTWMITFKPEEFAQITSIRLESFPKQPSEGNPNDKNHVINELAFDVMHNGRLWETVKLVNPRADFSQTNWDVAKSIDDDPKTGWAVSPKADSPHVAIYDCAEPINSETDVQLRIHLKQTYGSQLVLSRFRVSVSRRDPKQLQPVLDVDSREDFQRVFPATRELLDKINTAEKSLADVRSSIPKTPVMKELPADKLRQTRVHRRGNFLDQGDSVQAGVPAAFGELPADAPRNRLGVAQWTDESGQSAHRSCHGQSGLGKIVRSRDRRNRRGLRHTGVAALASVLLDWLAIDFRDHGWSLKQLLKTIVMSSTYRQSSVISETKLAKDPQNRLLSRGPRFRMSAEMIRDQALAASGLLSYKIGGPSVMPPQPDGVWKSTYSDRKWVNAEGEDRYRRGLYTYWKRTSPYPAMTTFDAGSGEVCLMRRVRTNTPLQALITLNDPAYFEAAGGAGIAIESTRDLSTVSAAF